MRALEIPATTAAYAEFAKNLDFDAIPADVIDIAKEQAVATIGSCLGGTNLPGGKALAQGLAIMGASDKGTLFGRSERMPVPSAALYNAGTAQIIDWDDWVLISHVGGCVVPTAFAAGEYANASGRELIAAIIIGNEIAGRTSRAIQRGAYLGNGLPNHQVETPLVAGRLMGLDELELRRAVGHSAYMAMENCHLGWTSDSKTLMNGLPAMWGIVSANLAKAGLIGNQDMVEHPAGYLATVSEEVDYSELIKGLGEEWYTRTLHTKRHPSCAYNLSAIECAIEIRRKTPDFNPNKIAKIIIDCPGVTVYVGTRYQAMQPDIYEQIRSGALSHVGLCFDGGFGVMAALVEGELTYRQYLAECIFSPELQRLRPLVEFRTNPEMQKRYYTEYKYGSRLEIIMEDGTRHVEERVQLLGARDRQFDHAEKFMEGAREVLPDSQSREAIDALRNLESVANINSISHLFRPS
jgi:2-methylcitrate dehydratase PrpD